MVGVSGYSGRNLQRIMCSNTAIVRGVGKYGRNVGLKCYGVLVLGSILKATVCHYLAAILSHIAMLPKNKPGRNSTPELWQSGKTSGYKVVWTLGKGLKERLYGWHRIGCEQ